MNGSALLGLILTGWLAQTTPPAAAPTPAPPQNTPVSPNLKLRIATSAYLSDGRTLGASASDWTLLINQPIAAYATSGRTLCNSRAATIERPDDAGYGWRVVVAPVREAASELAVHVVWQQMWEGGRALPDGKRGTVNLTLHPGDRVMVDYANAGSNAYTATGHLQPYYGKNRVITQRTDAGCSAVGMGLEIGLETAKAQPVVEAELWLVRPNRDGTEQSDRQVVRLPIGQPATSYFFDEQSLMTPRPVTIAIPTAKVSGELSAFAVEGGKIHLNFSVSRRYEGVLTIDQGNERSTNATYRDLVATPGEVLAFQLPTVEMPVIETTVTGGSPSYTVTSQRLPQLSVRLRAQIVR